jgi:outer membrane protein TolC
MRWKRLKHGLALLLAGVIGCKQTCYMTEGDLEHYHEIMPANLENDTNAGAHPVTEQSLKPSTILDPDRPIRYISLAEAMAIALEQGTIGNPSTTGFANSANGFGGVPLSIQTALETQVTFNGGAGGRVGQSDSIRVLRLDPAIIGTGIESALSKFDAIWTTSTSWNNTDRPIATSVDVIQAGNANIPAIEQQDVTAQTGIIKPLPSGGVAGITFSTAYQFTNLQAKVNPSYRPTLQFGIEQPLLQGFGDEINQIRQAHPGSLLIFPGALTNLGPTAEGILVTRIRFDQQRTEFERNVQIMAYNVEQAYWNLYFAYWNLYSQEQALRFAYESWRITKAKYDGGTAALDALAQARGQYESFRANRLNALNDLLDQERAFRGMLGMVPQDGTRLVPSDQPTLAPYLPDWETALAETMALQPSIILCREEVKAAQLNLRAQENNLLPDLRFGATYDINAIGNRLDGPDSTGTNANAFRALASDHFNNWSLQLRLNVPIGWRNAYANVRIAKLQLARAYEVLRDQELKSQRFLAQRYRALFANYELIRAQRAAREAFGDQLKAKFQLFIAGRAGATLDVVLEAQRFWANALSQEYQAIRDYNASLAAFEVAKGTILTHNNIVISEGALPAFAQKRAVEHERERSHALEIRDHADYMPYVPLTATAGHVTPGEVSSAPSLPSLFKETPPLKSSEIPVLPAVPMVSDPAKAAPAVPGAEALKLPAGPAPTTSMKLPAGPMPTSADAMKLPAGPMPTSADAMKLPAAPMPVTTLKLPPAPPVPVMVPDGGTTLPPISTPTSKPSTFGTMRSD